MGNLLLLLLVQLDLLLGPRGLLGLLLLRAVPADGAAEQGGEDEAKGCHGGKNDLQVRLAEDFARLPLLGALGLLGSLLSHPVRQEVGLEVVLVVIGVVDVCLRQVEVLEENLHDRVNQVRVREVLREGAVVEDRVLREGAVVEDHVLREGGRGIGEFLLHSLGLGGGGVKDGVEHLVLLHAAGLLCEGLLVVGLVHGHFLDHSVPPRGPLLPAVAAVPVRDAQNLAGRHGEGVGLDHPPVRLDG